jgi:hypothetical protein
VTLSTPCALSPEAAREQWQSIFAGLLRCRAACHEDGLSRNSRDFVHRLTRANAPCYPRRVGLLTFWSYLLQIAITVVIIVIIVILVRSRYCIPMPAARNSKRAPDCSRPSAGGSAQGSFGPSTTGGSYTEPGPATLPTGATMGLSSSLTLIVTKGDIVIDGPMLAGMAAQPGDPPIDVILVAEEGDVIVSQTGVVSGSSSNSVHASDTGMYALATSPAGANGGIIKLIGVNVNIAGHVTGMVAGWGGDADATGLSVAGIGGRAIAVAGEGGAGGDVVICATDSIAISGTLEGGLGGISTFATARAANASIACAELGSAGPGGDVWLRGRSSGSACPVFFTGAGTATGGMGGFGGYLAHAIGGNDLSLVRPDPGGDAIAIGGANGLGVQPPPVPVPVAPGAPGPSPPSAASAARQRAPDNRREARGRVFIHGSPLLFVQRARIQDLAVKSRLPSMCTLREYAEAGRLMSYGLSLTDLYRRPQPTATRSSRARSRAISLSSNRFELVINLKTAKALAGR